MATAKKTAKKVTKTATKTAKKTTKTTKTVENNTMTAREIARKGALAYVGLHVAAYERVKPVFGATEKVFGEMVVKGEAIEAQAQGAFSVATTKAAEMTSKVREALPLASNDRVEELETEVEVLNKKIKAMAKKKTAAKKSAARVNTQKTVAKSTETKAA